MRHKSNASQLWGCWLMLTCMSFRSTTSDAPKSTRAFVYCSQRTDCRKAMRVVPPAEGPPGLAAGTGAGEGASCFCCGGMAVGGTTIGPTAPPTGSATTTGAAGTAVALTDAAPGGICTAFAGVTESPGRDFSLMATRTSRRRRTQSVMLFELPSAFVHRNRRRSQNVTAQKYRAEMLLL
eukprot:COSAG02_NODE_4371_length_5442_cov_3.279057_2_plen_180_part_00